MKKLLTVLLSVLMILSLAACSTNNGGNEGTEELSEFDQLIADTTAEFYNEVADAIVDAEKVNVTKGDIITELTEPVTITIWNTYYSAQQEAFQKMVDTFNASQDMITVNYEVQAYQDYDTNLLNAVRNGEGPNITNRYTSTAAQYVNDGLIANLQPYIDDPTIGIPNYSTSLIGKVYNEASQWGQGSIYVFPILETSEVLYINMDIYNELGLSVPKTWEELTENCKKIYEAKGMPGWGSDSETDTMIDRVMQLGSGYINAETLEQEIDEEAFKTALAWYAEGIKDGYFRMAGADMYHSGPFTNGLVASYIGSSAGSSYVIPYCDFELKVTCIPQSGSETFAPAWGGGWVCFDSTPEENLASYIFMKYILTNEDNACADFCLVFGAVPVYKEALNSAYFQDAIKDDVVMQALMETAPNINIVNSIPGADNVRNAFGYAIDTIAALYADEAAAE